ncbi:hypothetical protein ACOMHN_026905 [Nucella lapillus]
MDRQGENMDRQGENMDRQGENMDRQGNRPCQDRQLRNSTMFGGLMAKSGMLPEGDLQTQGIPNITFLQFSFQHSVTVRGWTLKGRSGGMFGPLTKRRGLVDSYVVTYQTEKGGVEILSDPETEDDEFVSDGNLAQPEDVTDVDLKTGVVTQTLRMAPVSWSGVPFMAVKLFVCAKANDLTIDELKAEVKDEDEDEDVSVNEMENELKHTRSGGTFTAAMDAAKAAMGINPPKPETDEFAQKPPYLPFTQCLHQPMWRYANKLTPVDQFSARGNPQQAWRAILGITYTPYLFPTSGTRSHRHQLLEILFRNRTHVTAVKVAGLGEAGEDNGRWGAVSKFSLLFKDPKTDKWVYYADSTGTPRVFTVGNRTRGTAQKVGVFHLPVPLSTDALGIFPHHWVNKPYFALDILACYMRDSDEAEDTNTDTTAVINNIAAIEATSKEGGKEGQKEETTEIKVKEEEQVKTSQGNNTEKQQEALQSQIDISNTESENKKENSTTIFVDRKGEPPEDTENPEEMETPEEEIKRLKEDIELEDMERPEPPEEPEPLEDAYSEDTELTEPTADLDEVEYDDESGKEQPDNEDTVKEVEDLKDIQRAIDHEQREIETLNIPEDMKAKIKDQSRDVGRLVSKIQTDAKGIVDKGPLKHKQLKPERKSKHHKGHKKKHSKKRTTAHKSKTTSSKHRGKKPHNNNRGKKGKAHHSSKHKHGKYKKQKTLQSVLVSKKKGKGHRNVGGVTEGSAKPAGSKKPSDWQQLGGVKPPSPKDMKMAVKGAVRDPIVVEKDVSGTQSTERNANDNKVSASRSHICAGTKVTEEKEEVPSEQIKKKVKMRKVKKGKRRKKRKRKKAEEDTNTDTTAVINNIAAIEATSKEGGKEGQKEETTEIKVKEEEQEKTSQGNNTEKQQEALQSQIDISNTESENKKENSTTIFIDRKGEPPEDTENPEETETPEEEIKRLEEDIELEDMERPEPPEEPEPLEDADSEDTELTEPTADLDEVEYDDESGKEKPDNEDTVKEVEDLKDNERAIDHKQRNIETLNIPEDMKAKIKDQGRDVGHLVSKIRTDAKRIVDKGPLKHKQLKPERKSKHHKGHKKKHSKKRTTAHKSKTTSSKHRGKKPHNNNRGKKGKAHHSSKHKHGKHKKQKTLQSVSVSKKKGEGHRNVGGATEGSAKPAGSKKPSDWQQLGGMKPPSPKDMKKAVKGAVRDPIVVEIDVSGTQSTERNANDNKGKI